LNCSVGFIHENTESSLLSQKHIPCFSYDFLPFK